MHRIEGTNVDTSSGVNKYQAGTVITAKQMNSIQEEFMTLVEEANLPILTQSEDTKTQIWTAIKRIAENWQYVVRSQPDFVDLFTRTAANTYVFNTNYSSVYFKNIDGGYDFSSVLSGGDTWGDMYTSNCTHVEFENGAYIDMGNLRGYLEVNTSGCCLKNVDIQGTGTVASAISSSFLLNNTFVTFENCKTSNRLSNVAFYAFKGSATALHNYTSKYSNCSVFTIDSSSQPRGFDTCYNLINSLVYDLDSSGDHLIAFQSCINVSGFYVYDLQAANNFHLDAFDNCTNISNGVIRQLDTTGTGVARAFENTKNISTIHIIDIDSANNCYGILSSNNISSCKIEDLDSAGAIVVGIHSSNQVAACEITDLLAPANFDVYGIHTSNNVSSCQIDQLDTSGTGDAYGLYQSNQISASEFQDIDAVDLVYGAYDSDQISACKFEDLESSGDIVRGLSTCNNVSSTLVFNLLSPVNIDVYGMTVCSNVAASKVQQIDTSGTGDAYGIINSFQIAASEIIDLDGADRVYGIRTTDQVAACQVQDLDSSGGDASGFTLGDTYAACKAFDIQGTGEVNGFESIDSVAACYAAQIDSSGTFATGFHRSDRIVGSFATDIDMTGAGDAVGIRNCDYIAGNYTSIIASSGGNDYGYEDCNYGAALNTSETANPTNTNIDTTDAAIAAQFSCHATNWT